MERQQGVCRYCGMFKPFAKAHVISKNLFKNLFERYGRVHFLNVANIDANRPVQDAFFDRQILCADCDRSFSRIENYFAKLVKGELLKFAKTNRVLRTDYGEYMVDTYRPVDALRLRLFYLLTLWRCSISKLDTFNPVDLGTDESLLHDLLRAGDPGDYLDYAAVLVSFAEVDDIRALSALGPANAKVDGVPITVILFDEWAIIYCLKKQITDWFFRYALDNSGELSVVLFKEPFGVKFLDQLTRHPVHLRTADVPGLLEAAAYAGAKKSPQGRK